MVWGQTLVAHPIPTKITLPFGYKVQVRQVPYAEILLLGSEGGGHWAVETRTLYLDQDLPLKERRYWLMSQLHHIVLDANHELLDNGTIKPND